jgi:hypothetical protein
MSIQHAKDSAMQTSSAHEDNITRFMHNFICVKLSNFHAVVNQMAAEYAYYSTELLKLTQIA